MDTDLKRRAFELLVRHQAVSADVFAANFRERDGKVFGRIHSHEPLIEIDVEARTITLDDFPDGKFTIAA